MIKLSKLLDAERDWFNRNYLNSLSAFEGKGWNFPTHFASGYHVTHDAKSVKIAIDLPCVKMDNVNVELMEEDSVLRVYGERNVEVDGHVHELTFDKRFTLGDEVDKENLTANLESGVLAVTAPKIEGGNR